MTCPVCGRYAEPDRETGYDADDMCPRCAEAFSDIVDEAVESPESTTCKHSYCTVWHKNPSGYCNGHEPFMPKNAQVPDKVDPIESDLHDLGSVLASLADLVKDCHDPAKLFDVYCELGKIARATLELQDAVGEIQLKVARQ